MSVYVEGGINYALVKNHYDCDDYPYLTLLETTILNGIPFTATPDFYTVGLCAYFADPTVFDVNNGWCFFSHGQQNYPAWMPAAYIAALSTLGVSWLTIGQSVGQASGTVPAFEAKDLLFYATEDCWVSFVRRPRVREFIPQETWMRFHRRCLMFWVVRNTANGTLRFWLEG